MYMSISLSLSISLPLSIYIYIYIYITAHLPSLRASNATHDSDAHNHCRTFRARYARAYDDRA